MATNKQIEANRLNAKKSTGPRSVAGKAVCSMNALKSGIDAESHIIPGEDLGDLDSLTRDYLEQFHPATAQERQCVDILVRADWQLRRLARADAAIWKYQMDSVFRLNEVAPMGQAFCRGEKSFTRLQRRTDAAERSYYRALHELERLQAARPQPSPPPQATQAPAASPQIGFVPQTTSPPTAAPEPLPPENRSAVTSAVSPAPGLARLAPGPLAHGPRSLFSRLCYNLSATLLRAPLGRLSPAHGAHPWLFWKAVAKAACCA
jgi:hypothetical protein